ncbi:MAG: carboxypeptidase-like regulatory domain-containing protein [[Clostridium] nexile]
MGNKSATTDANGKYQFDGLELGTYNMAVSKPGYQAFSGEVKVEDKENNVKDIESIKSSVGSDKYDSISLTR